MSERKTSLDAYAEQVGSGKQKIQQRAIIELLVLIGPLTAFEINDLLHPGDRYSANIMRARIDDLLKLDILGYVEGTRENPATGRPGEIYGLVSEHGAEKSRPDDRVEIKYKGVRYSKRLEWGTLLNLSDVEIVTLVRALCAPLDPLGG